MTRLFTLAIALHLCCNAFSQDSAMVAAIEKEGKKLYRSEMASWNGTDIFLKYFPSLRPAIGGYLSYEKEDSTICVFFSKDPHPNTLGVISFNSNFDLDQAMINSIPRPLNQQELDLHLMRKKALEIINKEDLFKIYNNTSLNLIPLIDGKERRVYVLTGPKTSGIVLLGNDYLIEFSENNEVLSMKALHRNLIPIETDQQAEVFASIHNHQEETGEYITPTDICTLMLYGKYTKWKQHIVISKSMVSIWDFEKNRLVVLSREAWEKMNGKR